MRPYVVRFVSRRSGVGKTWVASRLARRLLEAGYSVGVVKHSASGIALEEKDSKRYLEAGVPLVVVAGRDIAVFYTRELVDDLGELLRLVRKPLVLVEGFRGSDIGDSVVVSDDLGEASRLLERSTIAVVLTGETRIPGVTDLGGIPVFYSDSIDRLSDVLVERALNHLLGQLPGLNCGLCGFETCRSLALKVLKGAEAVCPVLLDVRLVVDGREVRLNPFVKNVVSSVIRGMVSVLKDVPRDAEVIRLEVRRSGTDEIKK